LQEIIGFANKVSNNSPMDGEMIEFNCQFHEAISNDVIRRLNAASYLND
jgi:hypothetical protein